MISRPSIKTIWVLTAILVLVNYALILTGIASENTAPPYYLGLFSLAMALTANVIIRRVVRGYWDSRYSDLVPGRKLTNPK